MAYSINRRSDSVNGLQVADGAEREDYLSIPLLGRGRFSYGEKIQENLLHIMENFSNAVAPQLPTPGQLWHENTTDTIWIWNQNGGWSDIRQPLDGRIFNVHIADNANIDIYKLRPNNPSRMIVIDSLGVPTWVDMTGDVLVNDSGNLQIQPDVITENELLNIINQDQTFGSLTTSTDRNFNLLAHDNFVASLNIHGASQGSGRLYLGQDILSGGGIMFNGDNTPILPGTQDYTSFYRRSAGTDTEVFRYSTTSNQVDFHGEITSPRIRTGIGEFTFLENNYLQLQGSGDSRIELRSDSGGQPYIDFSNDLIGDYDARLQLTSDSLVTLHTTDLNVGTTSQLQNTSVRVLASDANIASIEAYGDSDGTGLVYIGQNSQDGGGLIHNGDNTPGSIVGTQDYTSFYRRSAGIDTEVFRYSTTDSQVFFNDNITYQGSLFVNDTNTRVTEGDNNSIRIQTNFGYVDVGPQSGTTTHFTTNKADYNFDRHIFSQGDITSLTGNFYLNNTSTQLTEGVADTLRVVTPTGYVDVGSQDTTWSHFSTDRSGFRFNQNIHITGDLTVDGGDIYLNNTDTHLSEGVADTLRITTPTGYVDIGSQNASTIHFSTDKSGYAFDKPVALGGGLVLSGGDIFINDTNTHLLEGDNDVLRMSTPTGYVDIGSQSVLFADFYTDRPDFYFNKPIHVDDILRIFNTNTFLNEDTLQLRSSNTPNIELRSDAGNNPFIDFSNDAVIDYDIRVQLDGNDELNIQGGNLDIQEGSVQSGRVADTVDRNVIVNSNTNAWFQAYGTNNLTSGLYIGESITDGSLVQYNSISSQMQFQRRLGATDTTTAYYNNTSNDWNFTNNIFVEGGSLYLNNTNTELSQVSGNILRIQTDSGYTEIGVNDATWSRFLTDRTQYFFDKQIHVTDRVQIFGTSTYLDETTFNLVGNGSPRIELRSFNNGSPYIDFSNDVSSDYDMRVRLANNSELNILGGGLDVQEGSLQVGRPSDISARTLNVTSSTSAFLNAYGDGSANAGFYIGKDLLFGGFMYYQASSDRMQFIRRDTGVDSITAYYTHDSDDWNFSGDIDLSNLTVASNIYINDTNTRITEGTNNSIKVQTNSGQVDIGAQNTSALHFSTDRPVFDFNSPLDVSGSIDIRNNSINRIFNLEGEFGNIARSSDEFLRLNHNNTHVSGVYVADNFRIDGETRFGTSGLQVVILPNGNTTFNGLTTFNSPMLIESTVELNNNNIIEISRLDGQFGNIAVSTDEWLRLNDTGNHSNGILTPGLVRADGGLQVGNAGNQFLVTNTGDTTINGTSTINGTVNMNGFMNINGNNTQLTSTSLRMSSGGSPNFRLDSGAGGFGYIDFRENGSHKVRLRNYPGTNEFGIENATSVTIPDGSLFVEEAFFAGGRITHAPSSTTSLSQLYGDENNLILSHAKFSGGTSNIKMLNNLDVSDNSIINVGRIVMDTDATSEIDMGGNKITDLPTPTSNNEPATKIYVDNNRYILKGFLMRTTSGLSAGGTLYSPNNAVTLGVVPTLLFNTAQQYQSIVFNGSVDKVQFQLNAIVDGLNFNDGREPFISLRMAEIPFVGDVDANDRIFLKSNVFTGSSGMIEITASYTDNISNQPYRCEFEILMRKAD